MRGILLLINLHGAGVGGADLGKGGRFIVQDIGLILAISGLLAVGAFFWAVRRSQHGRRRRHHSKPSILQSSEIAQSTEVSETSRPHRHRRRRRRRRDHRSRNPSLAETGGLPPVRSEDSSPSSSA